MSSRVLVARTVRLVHQSALALRAAGRLALDLLRELGDERPYGRFLAATGQAHSSHAWRQFTDERLKAKFKRPKCC